MFEKVSFSISGVCLRSEHIGEREGRGEGGES